VVTLLRAGLALALSLVIGCKSNDTTSPDLSAPGGTIPCDPKRDAGVQCPTDLPMCDPNARVCVGCIDSFETCQAFFTCDPKAHKCVPADPNAPCRKNADCPRPGFDNADAGLVVCEVDAGHCVRCVSNTDCNQPATCHLDTHQCIGPSTDM
jgi:hypothetical protein